MYMKVFALAVLAFASALRADTAPVDVARQLYDSGMQQTAEGKLANARSTFQGLIDRYSKNPLAIDAKGAIDATLLFEEGQARAKAGRYKTARVAYETLIAVYPENPLAARAKSAIDGIAEKEKVSRPVLQSVEFRDVAAVPPDEIRAEMEAREIRLNIGQPCRSKDVKQAKVALVEILAEKGLGHVKVEARTRTVSPHSVAVIFTVERSHAWLWRPKAQAATE
jgi:outer membrane protein assembly factor BamD (BamD/ComL family)